MADIKIRRAHSMQLPTARKEAEKIAKELQTKFDLEYKWSEDRIVFERQGVSGHMEVTKESVTIEAKLGMLLSFLKPTIEGHINDNLDRVFAGSTKTATTDKLAKPATKPVKTAAKAPAKKR
jgi:putative polyhydroxyalkanoate system protein